MEEQMAKEKELENILIKTLGKVFFGLSCIILLINLGCRLFDAVQSEKYAPFAGTVTNVIEGMRASTSRKHSGDIPYYNVWVGYSPFVDLDFEIEIDFESTFNKWEVGDKVTVMHRIDSGDVAYVAKKDWLTGKYLPIEKNYDIPLIIAAVLTVLGFIFYKNLSILDWYANGAQIKIKKS